MSLPYRPLLNLAKELLSDQRNKQHIYQQKGRGLPNRTSRDRALCVSTLPTIKFIFILFKFSVPLMDIIK